MSYRRNIRSDQNGTLVDNEQIPLPIETVYNSVVDSLKKSKESEEIEKYGLNYYHGSDDCFNRIYFKYPPEWKTSNVGEKIIGIRNMLTTWRDGELNFVLYIRKYDFSAYESIKEIFRANNESYNTFSSEQKQQIIIDNLNSDQVRAYQIPIHIKVSSDNNWIDIKDQIRKAIDEKNLYNHLRDEIIKRDIAPDQRTVLLNQLEQIKDDYRTMLQASNELIGENIPFYLQSSDVDIIDTFDNNERVLKFTSRLNEGDDRMYGINFCIMKPNDSDDEDNVDYIYNKLYQGPYSYNRDKHILTDEGKLPSNEEEDDEDDDEPEINEYDRFEPYTAYFFNIGTTNQHRNEFDYVIRYNKMLVLKNLMTNLQCVVTASFANQSNHNVIGRTNETFTPIKYYKINDDDNKFWIEFYDKNEIKIPIAINNNVIFTMDVVFLQNRKLIYS